MSFVGRARPLHNRYTLGISEAGELFSTRRSRHFRSLDRAQRFIIASPRATMTTAGVPRDPAAWGAEDKRWYASLIAHCHGLDSTDDVLSPPSPTITKPSDGCLQMAGEAELDDRVEDCNGRLWSTDQKGRWFATVDRKVRWLHIELLRIGCGRRPGDGEVGSHLCGNCGTGTSASDACKPQCI